MHKQSHLLYLHGFLSSPQSMKAQQTIAYCDQIGMQDCYTFPEMTKGPRDTIADLCDWVGDNAQKEIVIIGSSLGGYYASFLAEKYKLKAVLINPAIRPFDLWESHIGVHKNYYSNESYEVTPSHVDELRGLYIKEPKRLENILALVQTGDEVLNYQLAIDKYGVERCLVRPGGSHSFENFISELPAIFDFLLSRNSISVR